MLRPGTDRRRGAVRRIAHRDALCAAGIKGVLVDRATFRATPCSTHVVQPLAAARLARWGLLDRLVANGCPPTTPSYDFGHSLSPARRGRMRPPSRTARDGRSSTSSGRCCSPSGGYSAKGFVVDELLLEEGRVTGIRGHGREGSEVTERARGGSRRRRPELTGVEAVRAERYHERPPLLASYYSMDGLPMSGRFEIYIRPSAAARRSRPTAT